MRDEEEVMKVTANRAGIQATLERVAEQMEFIEAASTFDHGGEETVESVSVTLPLSVIYLARFLALMETESMPASLRLWNFAEGEGRTNSALQNRIGVMTQCYLEIRLEMLLRDELNRLYDKTNM